MASKGIEILLGDELMIMALSQSGSLMGSLI